MIRRILFITAVLAILTVNLFICGCSTPPVEPIDMTPTDIHISKRHPYTVAIAEIDGGNFVQGTFSTIGNPGIRNEDFYNALSNAISISGVFLKEVKSGEVDYELSVYIIDNTELILGLDFNTIIEMRVATKWVLTDTATNKICWEEIILSSCKDRQIPMYNYKKIVGINIAEGILRLSELDL